MPRQPVGGRGDYLARLIRVGLPAQCGQWGSQRQRKRRDYLPSGLPRSVGRGAQK